VFDIHKFCITQCPQVDSFAQSRHSTLKCLTGFVIYYSSDKQAVRQAYWTQLILVNSLFIGALSALGQHQLTLHHLSVVVQLTGPPSLFYMTYCALQSIRKAKHGLPLLMGHGLNQYTVTTLLTAAVWLVLFVFSFDPGHALPFSQRSCPRPFVWLNALNVTFHPFAPISSFILISQSLIPISICAPVGATIIICLFLVVLRGDGIPSDLIWWKWPRFLW
jgi:hypothetical protein